MLNDSFKYIAYERPPALPKDILAMSDEDIDAWDQAAIDADHHNNKVAQPHNYRVDAAWKALLKSMGVTVEGTRNGVPAHVRHVIDEMRTHAGVKGIPAHSLDSLRYVKWPLPSTYPQYAATDRCASLKEVIANVRGIIKRDNEQKNFKESDTKHWLETGPSHNLHLQDFPNVEAYVKAVRDADREKFIAAQEGTEMDIDFCDGDDPWTGGCTSWTVGESRCECGNRRVHLVVDWNARSRTWFAYPESH
jgi:hypothetical protein